jgi:hypothetical protein
MNPARKAIIAVTVKLYSSFKVTSIESGPR